MRFFLAILFCVFAHCSLAQSPSGSDILNLAIEKLPPCALKCTLSIIGASTCELTDIACIKSNEKLLSDLSTCVKSSCTIKQSLTAKKFLQQLMGAPVRNKTELGTLTTLIVGGVAVLAFILRAVARLPTFGGNWGPDDWVMTAAIILIIPLTICAYLLNQIGLGTDMWLVPFENITKILEIFYYTELLYLASIALTKISILLFYLRIFPHKGLRRVIWITIGACAVYLVVFVTATALQCIPISLAWTRWDGEHHGRCIDLNADAWTSAAFNILLDLVVIALPMRELKNLAMSHRRKFGVMLMFLGGLFITIVSMLRLKYLIQFAHTDNVTWDYLPIGYWSAVETHVGVMVACLPAIRALERSIRDRIWPKTTTQTSYYEDTHNSSTKTKSRKDSQSRMMSSMGRSKADKEDFVRLDEFDMKLRDDVEKGPETDCSPAPSSFERSMSQSFKSNEDVIPLAATAAPMGSPMGAMGQPMGSIMVRSEFTVDRVSPLAQTAGQAGDYEKRRFRLGSR